MDSEASSGTIDWRNTFNITIIGAGPVGLTTAIYLRKAGYPVKVLEREPEIRSIGAGIQLPITHNKVLQELSILEEVEQHAWLTRAIVLHKYNSGKQLFRMPLNPDVRRRYGAPHLIVHRADLRRILLAQAQSLGAEIRLNAQIDFAASELAKGLVVFKDGGTLQSSLVIGADGEHSLSRDAMLGSKSSPTPNGRVAIRACISWKIVESDPELMSLFSPKEPCIRTWLGPESQVVAYPLKDELNLVFNRLINTEPFYGPRPADKTDVMKSLQGWDPVIQKVMNLSDQYLMWMTFETGVLDSFIDPAGKFALIGDAAHSMVPYLGHGAAMGMEDASVLGNLMYKANSASQIPKVLHTWNNLRQPRTTLVKRASVKMGEYWHLSDGPLCDERDRQLLNEIPSAGFPNLLSDPFFQHWIWSYDPKEDATRAWSEHFQDET